MSFTHSLILFAVIASSSTQCPWNHKLATIGSYTITQKDVELRDAVNKVYFPEETRSFGLQQLTDAYIYAEILKNHGAPVTAAQLQAEEVRIEKESLIPEMLVKVKKIFRRDAKAFQRIFVLPIYAERVLLFDIFLKDTAAQASQFKMATDFLAVAQRQPRKFAELAKRQGLAIRRFTVSLREGLHWETERSRGEGGPMALGSQARLLDKTRSNVSEEGKEWVEKMIKPLRRGAVLGKVVDLGSGWLVAHYLQPQKGKVASYQLEGVIFPKADFADWVEKEKKNVRIVLKK